MDEVGNALSLCWVWSPNWPTGLAGHGSDLVDLVDLVDLRMVTPPCSSRMVAVEQLLHFPLPRPRGTMWFGPHVSAKSKCK